MAKKKLSVKKVKWVEIERLMAIGFREGVAEDIVRASGPALARKTIQWLRHSWRATEKMYVKIFKEMDTYSRLKPTYNISGMVRISLLQTIEEAIGWSNQLERMEAELKQDNLTVPSVDIKESQRILWGAREAIMHFPPRIKRS